MTQIKYGGQLLLRQRNRHNGKLYKAIASAIYGLSRSQQRMNHLVPILSQSIVQIQFYATDLIQKSFHGTFENFILGIFNE